MQDDVAPAVALPQTPESLPVDPRHNKAPKTPTSLDDLSKEDIAAALDRNLMEDLDLGENDEKDSDMDSDNDSDSDDETGEKKPMTLETVMKLIKEEPTEEPKVASVKKKTKAEAEAQTKARKTKAEAKTKAKAEAQAKAASAKKRTRIQMIQDLTEEDAVEEIVAPVPVPTNKDAGICQVLESLV